MITYKALTDAPFNGMIETQDGVYVAGEKIAEGDTLIEGANGKLYKVDNES